MYLDAKNQPKRLEIVDRLCYLQNRKCVPRNASTTIMEENMREGFAVFVTSMHTKRQIPDKLATIQVEASKFSDRQSSEVIRVVSIPRPAKIVQVRAGHIADLNPTHRMSIPTMNLLSTIANGRDYDLIKLHGVAKMKPSLFAPVEIFSAIFYKNWTSCDSILQAMDIRKLKYLFIPFKEKLRGELHDDNFAGIAIDIQDRLGWYITPHFSSVDRISAERYEGLSTHYKSCMNDFLRRAFDCDDGGSDSGNGSDGYEFFQAWSLLKLEGDVERDMMVCDCIEDNFNSGPFVFTLFDFFYHGCPPLIRNSYWDVFRQRLAFALFTGSFPKFA